MGTFYWKLAFAALAGLSVAGPGFAQDIPVAVVGPMTGQYATYGDQLSRGAKQAVEDINAAGGVLGRKLVLEVGDDACDPRQAVTVANQLASKEVALVVGHYCSSSSIPASAVYNESGILQISPASTNPHFTDDAFEKGWNNVFRISGRDDDQGAVAAQYILDNFIGKSVAIIHDKSAYGKGLVDEMKKRMNEGGLQELLYEAITVGDKDFSAVVSKLKQANIDVVYFGGYAAEAGLIVRQMREQGLEAQFIGGDTLLTPDFYKVTGAAGDGTMMTFHPDPRNNPTAQDVVAKFREAGFDPEGYTLYAYSVLQIFKAAAEQAGAVDLDTLSETLKGGTTFDAVLGNFTFNEKGDVTNPDFVFYVWKDGEYTQL